jgi:hypothetical protein
MKNKKVTRLQLENNGKDDFIILGLVCSEPDYKLSLSINKKSGISLKNVSPVKINESEAISFSRFSFTNTSSGTTCNLISNRHGKSFLFRKLKNIDYIFQVYDPANEFNAERLSSDLRKIEAITAVFNIDLSSFKDKNLESLIL